MPSFSGGLFFATALRDRLLLTLVLLPEYKPGGQFWLQISQSAAVFYQECQRLKAEVFGSVYRTPAGQYVRQPSKTFINISNPLTHVTALYVPSDQIRTSTNTLEAFI